MKFILVLIIHVMAFLQMHAQTDTLDCSPFKTGLFAYRNDSSNALRIKRTRKIQEETNRVTGEVTRFRIRWVGNCSYELKQLWGNSKAIRKNNGSTTIINIIKTGKDQYEFSCSCKNAEEFKMKQGIVYKFQ